MKNKWFTKEAEAFKKANWRQWTFLITVMSVMIITFTGFRMAERGVTRRYGNSVNIINLDREMGQMTQALFYELLLETRSDRFSLFRDLVSLRDGFTAENYADLTSGNWERNYRAFEEMTQNQQRRAAEEALQDSVLSRLTNLHHIFDRFYSFQYVAIDHDTNRTLNNGDIRLRELVTRNINDRLINQLNEEFQQILVIHYHRNGQEEVLLYLNDKNLEEINEFLRFQGASISLIHGPNFPFTNMDFSINLAGNEPYFYWRNPSNMTFIYAIPRDLAANDPLIFDQRSHVFVGLGHQLNNMFLFSLPLVGLAIFLLPPKLIPKNRGYLFIRQYPIEITGLIIGILWLVLRSQNSLLPGILLQSSDLFSWPPLSEGNGVILITISAWFLMLYGCAYLTMYVKELIRSGFKQSLKESSLLITAIGRARLALAEIDLKNEMNRKLFFIFLLQVIIISMLFLVSATLLGSYLYGVIGLGSYMIVLFLVIRKKLSQFQEKYVRLFEITNQLTAGSFDVQMNEDLGPFNSMKNELMLIKAGFEKAISNEMNSEKMKTDLIANVSHDLRTPLTSIITYTDLLKSADLCAKKSEQYLTTLDQNANRLRALIEDLFEVSKASSRSMILDLQEIDVVALMKQTLLELEDKLAAVHLNIRSNFPDHKVKLKLDGERMYRVFENLLINVSKYGMPHTRAYIDIEDHQDQVKILLRNISVYEISINANELAERFVRGDQSRHTEGSGLGLAIAKSFVELQGGIFEIQVDGDLFKVMMTFSK